MSQQMKGSLDQGALAQATRTLRLVWRLLNDPRVPILTKLVIPGILLYVVSPIDLIPDVMPIVGQVDDLAVIFFGIRFFIQICPPDVVLEHSRAISGETHDTRGDYVDATYRVVNDDDKTTRG